MDGIKSGRIIHVAIKLDNGTEENYDIGEDDAIVLFIISEKQDIVRRAGYAGSMKIGLLLMLGIVEVAQNMMEAINQNEERREHRN